ncbi:hypothetical protein EG68_08700 [Paragonimus skrjabini miyazakii]|uniref:Choline/carnitine acyltransferase domain-containing protein n=1 Tax=Paragonimus skrjabini miyazakii TaxID=59628 RepID=A0A8S9YKZ2_9TREM|nr:hypothetical protein EG68_08700 [Paragonimus skrjabini miyazakii]
MRRLTRPGLTPAQLFFRSISRGYSSNVADVPYSDFLATDHFQPSLPRLKVPPLEVTIERYINSQKALLSETELDKTSGLATKFLTDRGPQLQRELVEYARVNSHTSYITDLWFDMYLSDRRPVVLTHNPVMVLQNTTRGPGYQQPAVRATNLIFGAIRFRQLLSSNKLEPEVFHLNPSKSKTPLFYRTMRWVPKSVATYAAYMFNAYPLDMSQYPSMFNSTRIPKPGKDSLFRNPSARHLLVIHRGQLYVFDVFDVNGDPVSPKQVLSNIQFILSRPPVCTAPGLGVITTMDRDQAYAVRKRLIALGNRANLDLIDSALLALVLDDEPQMDIKSTLLNFLTGPAESRWFDKSLSLLIDRTGCAAINFEHSWGDGVAVVRLSQDMFEQSEKEPVVSPDDLIDGAKKLPESTVQRLEWLVDDHLVSDTLKSAREAYEARRHSVVLHFDWKQGSLSKRLCKQANLSADSMMQLSFQLANDLMHGQPAATYESCSTAAFKHGRTETLRSATLESRTFVEMMRRQPNTVVAPLGSNKPVANAVDEDTLRAALSACSTRHMQLTKEAAMGQGWDRHLFALRHFAQCELGRTLPDLFTDEHYTRINAIILSTSTLSSSAFSMGGFAAVHPDGYGIGYGINDERCGAVVTSWRGSSCANAVDFVDAFTQSADRLATLIRAKST